ncbi:MAG: hypothetical protein HC888_11155 [Candidatus Competibacteraceae bacterium]|nr:hypothetical protein [Candidatus Competibacteraceae bacterium]
MSTQKFKYLLTALLTLVPTGVQAKSEALEPGKGSTQAAFFKNARNEVDYPRLSKVAGYAIRVSVEKLDIPRAKTR